MVGEREESCRTQESWRKQEAPTARVGCLRSVYGFVGVGVGWWRQIMRKRGEYNSSINHTLKSLTFT